MPYYCFLPGTFGNVKRNVGLRWVFLFLLGFVVCRSGEILSQDTIINAEFVIEQSISYHDPGNRLSDARVRMVFAETRPGSTDRKSTVILQPSRAYFALERSVDEQRIFMEINGDAFRFALNGKTDLTPEELSEHRLTPDRARTMRDYYHYLWFMPMKLKDQGTRILPGCKKVNYFGKSLYEVKVTYYADVGSDIWYFYFDPENYALSGYRFYHDEEVGDGEYILFDGELEVDGIRIPNRRSWYTHGDNRFLGEDTLLHLETN